MEVSPFTYNAFTPTMCKKCGRLIEVNNSGIALELCSSCYYSNLNTSRETINMASFESGATRTSDNGKLDYQGFLSPIVLKRYAEYMHKFRDTGDGKLRESDNWKKGIPRKNYKSSLIRHVVDVWLLLEGYIDAAVYKNLEDALCAVIFNSMGLLHEILIKRDAK